MASFNKGLLLILAITHTIYVEVESDPQNPFEMGMRFFGEFRDNMRTRFNDLMGRERRPRPPPRPVHVFPQGHQPGPGSPRDPAPAVFKESFHRPGSSHQEFLPKPHTFGGDNHNTQFKVIHVNDVDSRPFPQDHRLVNHNSRPPHREHEFQHFEFDSHQRQPPHKNIQSSFDDSHDFGDIFDSKPTEDVFGFSEIRRHPSHIEEKSEIIYESSPLDESDWKAIPNPYSARQSQVGSFQIDPEVSHYSDPTKDQTLEFTESSFSETPLYYSDISDTRARGNKQREQPAALNYYDQQQVPNILEEEGDVFVERQAPKLKKRRRRPVRQFQDQRQRSATASSSGGIMIDSGIKREISKSNGEEDHIPQVQSYEFGYDVADGSSGNTFSHSERFRDGTKQGSYEINLPDGRVQKVEYRADSRGFHPKITFEGEAKYPPSSTEVA